MKILIIEDEFLILKTLETFVVKSGHQVDTSQSGRKAIELLQTNSFDLIITDLMLNDISGFDIIEESKKVYSAEEIQQKIIVITAYKSDDIINRVKGYGCRFFEKPFVDVKATIDQMLSAPEL